MKKFTLIEVLENEEIKKGICSDIFDGNKEYTAITILGMIEHIKGLGEDNYKNKGFITFITKFPPSSNQMTKIEISLYMSVDTSEHLVEIRRFDKDDDLQAVYLQVININGDVVNTSEVDFDVWSYTRWIEYNNITTLKTDTSMDKAISLIINNVYKASFNRKHLIVDEKDYNESFGKLSYLEFIELMRLHSIDFFSIKKYGTIEYTHITDTDNEDFIEKNLALVAREDSHNGLGDGIHVITDNNHGKTSLARHLQTMYDSELRESDNEDAPEVLKYTGMYTGEYIECIYGRDHEGYIVLPVRIARYNYYDFVPVQDLLDEWL